MRRGAMIGGGLLGTSYLAKYGSQVLLARWMPTDDFGTYAYLVSWVLLLSIPADLGLGTASLRLVPEYRAKGSLRPIASLRRFSHRVTLATASIIATVAICVTFSLGRTTGAVLVILIAAALIPLQALVTLRSELTRSTGRVGWTYGPSHVFQPLAVIIMCAGAFSIGVNLGAETVLLATAASLLLTCVIQLAVLHVVLPERSTDATRKDDTKRWTRISIPLMLISVSSLLISRSDVLIVGALEGPLAAGLYHAASRTASFAQFPLIAFAGIAAPLIASLHAQGDSVQLARMVRAAARWTFLTSAAVALLLVLFGRQVLGLFGEDFSAAHSVLVILCIAHLFNASCGPVGYLLTLTGAERECLRAYAVCAMGGTFAGVILTKLAGSAGAALASAGTLTVLNMWLVVAVRRRLGFWAFAFATRDANPPSGTAETHDP